MSVTSTLLLRGLARGKARFACAALGVAAAAGAVVFVFSLAASNAAQAPSLARRAATPWAAWRFEGMPAGPWGAGRPPESKPHAEKKSHAESAEKESHAESAEIAEIGRARAPRVPGSPAGGAAERSEAEGVIQHSAFSIQHFPSSASLAIARILAAAAGPAGVVGGQWVDVTSSPPHDEARVSYVHAHKTGDLIACACEMGAIAAGAASEEGGSPRSLAREYGRALGLAFQIVDDLLDAGDPAKASELSILRVATPEEARAQARAATERALRALDALAAIPARRTGSPDGRSGSPDGRAPSRPTAALALLRSLAEDQLSRNL